MSSITHMVGGLFVGGLVLVLCRAYHQYLACDARPGDREKVVTLTVLNTLGMAVTALVVAWHLLTHH